MTDAEMISSIVKCPSPFDAPLKWEPTQFEQMLEKLGLTEADCIESPTMRSWCKANKNTRYIPEAILQKLKLTVSYDLY